MGDRRRRSLKSEREVSDVEAWKEVGFSVALEGRVSNDMIVFDDPDCCLYRYTAGQ